ncbi:hypothetical protein CC85DRAFT_282480 [Cutaneotrichosporon oleaginosum]|uniref:MIF4G domain-containing protein n=1 Tax=Cutaneotrichosporon oleaginosum TaxID=879819 RepID=A0A0J1BBP6_9TREE|nr:uncharacterized protein CC85DRAFT_282480 [Cutaneotrichosporon oleaginosum]KLT45414.1 hypothetical protein CC85DRAFT_282480 [Cutaneotrichosporon oleaginosum]
MSKASTPNKPLAQSPAPNASAWSRGPPAAASNPSSNVNSTASTPPPPPNGASANEPTGSIPVAIGGGNTRKGSLMVGGNGDVMPRGNLAFGTVDSPNPLLSSSPAAPSTTGGHLADAVKSFGSLDAETTAAGASMIRPPRRTSGGNPATPTQKKQLDPHNIHSFFVGKPQHSSNPGTPLSPSQVPASGPQDRRQSGGSFPGPNGMPPYQQMPGMPNQPHLRSMPGMPGGQRSPVMGGAPQPQYASQQVGQPGYRPSQPQMAGNPAVRPNGPMMGRPPMGQVPYGLPPGTSGYMMYGQPGGGYYVGRPYGAGDSSQYNPYGSEGYGWQGAPQHAPNMPLSPRQGQAQLASPVPPSATLPPSGGGSPLPTPPSRPQSLVGGHQSGSPMPSTPSRPLQPSAPFTPSTPSSASAQASAALSAGAATFTPRAPKSTIKISRPDGTTVNLAEEAAAAKGPTPSTTSGVATPEQSTEEAPKPQKKVPGLPVVVRLESEEQKRQRLEEEARIAKMKEQEKREEAERKERQERRAKEEAESKAKAEAEKAEAKSKADEETKARIQAEVAKAKEAAEAKAKEEAEATTKEMIEAAEATKAERSATPKSTDVAEEPATTATPVNEKQDELRRSVLTPTTQSAAPSPLASPALAAAGLPAKPVAAIGGTTPRRPTSSLDSKPAASTTKTPSSGPSALSTAKAIDDLGAITYPSSVKPQSAELNANGDPGKFRYERDFLMQFQTICKDKPDSLPPLEEIGLEADSSSGFGSTRRAARPSTGRSMTTLASSRGFQMGSFATSNNNYRTPDDRYPRGAMQGSGGRPSRTASQGNNLPPMSGLPHLTHSSSGRGRLRESNRGRPRAAHDSRHPANDPDVTPLVVSENAWVNARSAGSDDKSPAFIERKVKALLNKLTEEKFESISEQILEWANKSRDETDGMTLKLVIKLVFEKSTDEAHWSAMYAKLCRKLLDKLDPSVTEVIDGKPYTGGSLFRKYLLGRCQSDFESGWKAREEAALAAVAKSDEDKERLAKAEETKEDGASEAPMMSEEYYALQKAKRRGLGLVQLIGELYKLDMLSKGVIRECLIRLLSNVDNPDEEDLESTCKLLTTVGKQFEAVAPPSMDVVFERLEILTKLDSLSSRIRFMIMDIVDLRKNKWRSRKEVVPTTIAQIHQQAARENAEKAQAAQQVRESMSRGGSRSGHSRREGPGPQPGEWQSVSATSRPMQQRPVDFSNIGRGVSSNLSSGPTFGPSSVFARGKKGGAGNTPPLSRQNSSANMFAMLNEADPTAAEHAEPAPQRKKLQLKPRTKPIPGEGESDGEGEQSGEEEGPEDETVEVKPAMSEEDAKTKIATDLKELWGEKDVGGTRSVEDIVEYYRALPTEHQHLLSENLTDDVFRIAKYRDAEVVAKGWAAALKAEVVSADDLSKGIAHRMASLDDEAVDFPQAYKSIALLMRTISLSQEDIDALLEKVDIYGTPTLTPKMKLEKAFAQLDEEASA